MHAAAKTNRFLTGYSKPGFADAESVVSNDAFLHQAVASQFFRTVTSHELFLNLCNDGNGVAKQAYLKRDLDVLEETSGMPMNLPLIAARRIGLYHPALALNLNAGLKRANAILGPKATIIVATSRVYRRQCHCAALVVEFRRRKRKPVPFSAKRRGDDYAIDFSTGLRSSYSELRSQPGPQEEGQD